MPFPIAALAGLAIEAVPSLVRWIAGDDAGDVADKVSGIAKRVTGASTDEEAVAAIRANPELFAKFQAEAAALDADLEKAYLADRQDARKRDVELRRLGDSNVRANVMLAMAFTCLCLLLYMVWDARLDLPDHIFAAFNMAIGMLLKMISDAFQFEFGSSRGSRMKDNRP